MYDPMYQDRKRENAGFLYGFIGAFLMICINIIILLLYNRTNQGDWVVWFLEWPVYFFLARAAAYRQYKNQRDTLEPFRNVIGAGVGAALITCILGGVFIFIRNAFAPQLGIKIEILVEPLSLCLSIFLSVLLAMGLGALGGKTVVDRYQIKNGY